MCQTVSCIGCGKPAKSCSLINGKCYSCRSKPVTPIAVPQNQTTPPNNYIDVYHTH